MAGRSIFSARTRASRRTLLSRALAVLTIVAFTLSSFLTQTHIHGTPAGASGPAVADIFDSPPGQAHDKAPGKNDPASCPLCQQASSAGHFVTPAVAAILLPSLSVSVIQTVALVR